jgi:hypothetical protein
VYSSLNLFSNASPNMSASCSLAARILRTVSLPLFSVVRERGSPSTAGTLRKRSCLVAQEIPAEGRIVPHIPHLRATISSNY